MEVIETNEGTLNGITIQMETIEDNFEKAIARYDYPYADGADLEDMGQKAHTLRFKCHFWDDAEQQTYSDHVKLIASLEDKGLLDFVHPKYGLLKGRIETIGVQHDDTERHASIDLTFIEQMRGKIEVTPAQSVQAAVEEAFVSGQTAQEGIIAQEMAAIIPDADISAVGAILDATQGLLAQMEGYANTTRLFVGGIESRLSAAEAIVNQIVSPADSLMATMTYSLNLPGRILGTISQTLEKYGLLNDSLRQYPNLFISRLNGALNDVIGAFLNFADNRSASNLGQQTNIFLQRHAQIAAAQYLALEAAAVFAADVDAANNPEDSDTQVMTINELESTLAIVRQRIEAAVEIARDMESLKTMAAALLTQVNSVRLEREKMITVTLDNPMPLHLVCLKYGMPYKDAERIIKVNNIKQPNYTEGEVFVYA